MSIDVLKKIIFLPEDLGGLGIVQMKTRNLALLAKLCWRLASNPDAPWALMLAKKYLTPTRINSLEVYRPCSQVWIACKEGGGGNLQSRVKMECEEWEISPILEGFLVAIRGFETSNGRSPHI